MTNHDHELKVLAGMIPGRNSESKARQLLAAFGTLRSVLNATEGQLQNFVSEKQAAYIASAAEAMVIANASLTGTRLACPEDATTFLAALIGHLMHEEFWVLTLSTKNYVLDSSGLYKGTLNSAAIRVAEVFRMPIILQGAAIIVAHNHPSDDPTPSPDDIRVTKQLVAAGKLLEIDVLDHIIIGGQGRHTSMKEKGLGFV